MRPENAIVGQPPLWHNFDAYVSPDTRVHNNANLVGADGVYWFNKCLSEHGYNLGSGSIEQRAAPSLAAARR